MKGKSEEETIETHPSYGMVGFSRVSGNTNLFASEFNHQHYMTLSISRAERRRDLSRDWYFDRQELIHISMSEAQFVELITSPNLGGGVPCTLNRVNGERMPDTPVREEMRLRYDAELKKTAKDATALLDETIVELERLVEGGKIGKLALRGIIGNLTSVARRIDNATIPFVESQFTEHVENTLSHAKVEIESHISAMAMRIGVDHMRIEAVQSAPQLIEGERPSSRKEDLSG